MTQPLPSAQLFPAVAAAQSPLATPAGGNICSVEARTRSWWERNSRAQMDSSLRGLSKWTHPCVWPFRWTIPLDSPPV